VTAMKILVAGAQGQLARALLEEARARDNLTIVALGRPRLDIADEASIARAIDNERPDVVVNAAAYTAVDKAESDSGAAFAVNCDGAGALAAAAEAQGCPIIHISTDYVFDGTKAGAYFETDPTNPTNVYGRSKLAGEAAAAVANARHVILRTSWLYAPQGHNFLITMLRLARERPELRVVADQRGNPTYAPHLARAILAICERLVAGAQRAQPWGIYHATSAGETTWAGFAAAIVEAGAARLGVPRVPVIPITTREYPTPARRPANSCLDCSKLQRVLGLELPTWQQGVEECIAELGRRAPAPT
jgi:dTDP-4-dehydrorhamnose reductase